MKQRIGLLVALVSWIALVLVVGGSAVKAGASSATVGGIELAAVVLGIAAGIVVRVRLSRAQA